MCRHTFHHYFDCGHIANYTLMSCAAFISQLRDDSKDWHSPCQNLKICHDIFPADHPGICLPCAFNWKDKSSYPRKDHELEFFEKNLVCDGFYPIIDFKARMVCIKRSQDTNMIHETRTDIYQCKPLRPDPECKCSACTLLVSVRPYVREDLDFLACKSPLSLDSLVHNTVDSLGDPDLDISRDLVCNSHEEIDPWPRLDLDHESLGVYTSADESIDVCEVDGLCSTLYDFDHVSCISSVDVFHIGGKDNLEPMPGSVADCLAQLNLDCVEDCATESTKIDLLAALPSSEEIILELIQAFRTGATSNDSSPEISPIANKPDANQKPPGISKTPTLNHSDSKTSLWHANMSSASSPDFRNNADQWLSDLELSSSGTQDHLDTPVQRGATAEFLDFLEDEEDGGCLLAGW